MKNSSVTVVHGLIGVRGGANTYVKALCSFLLSTGHQVGLVGNVVCDPAQDGYPEELDIAHMEDINTTKNLLAVCQVVLRLREHLKKQKTGLLILNTARPCLIGRLASVGLDINTVCIIHGLPYQKRPGRSRAAQLIIAFTEYILSFFTDRYVMVSHNDYSSFKRLGIPDKKLRQVYFGVRSMMSSDCIKTPVTKTSKINIVSVSRLENPKDPLTLIRSLTFLDQRVRLTIVGTGSMMTNCLEEIQRLHLTNRVKLVGELINPQEELNKADLFVLSSFNEGFPISVLEAMSAGLPVVLARAGGCCEVLMYGEVGLSFEPGDAHDLANQCNALLEDPERLQRFSDNALATWKNNFTQEIMHLNLASVLSDYV